MRYKSLRFFIQINRFVGYSVIYSGILLSLIGAIWLGSSVSAAEGFFLGFFLFILTLTIGGLFSVFQGLLIFAVGDLFQCFIDIEENTQRTVSTPTETNSNRLSIVETDEKPVSETSSSRFTYSPENNSERIITDQAVSVKGVTTDKQCIKCSTAMSLEDMFCSSCGYGQKLIYR
jgi:hypothetical protein